MPLSHIHKRAPIRISTYQGVCKASPCAADGDCWYWAKCNKVHKRRVRREIPSIGAFLRHESGSVPLLLSESTTEASRGSCVCIFYNDDFHALAGREISQIQAHSQAIMCRFCFQTVSRRFRACCFFFTGRTLLITRSHCSTSLIFARTGQDLQSVPPYHTRADAMRYVRV